MRLRRGADQLLAAWSNARTQAIETGQIYQFRFEQESGNYQIEPWDPVASSSPLGSQETIPSEAVPTEEESLWSEEDSLPEDVVFVEATAVQEEPQLGPFP